MGTTFHSTMFICGDLSRFSAEIQNEIRSLLKAAMDQFTEPCVYISSRNPDQGSHHFDILADVAATARHCVIIGGDALTESELHFIDKIDEHNIPILVLQHVSLRHSRVLGFYVLNLGVRRNTGRTPLHVHFETVQSFTHGLDSLNAFLARLGAPAQLAPA